MRGINSDGTLLCSPLPGSTDADGDGSDTANDCDDNNAAVRPGAADVTGNFVDDDCGGQVDEGGFNPDPQLMINEVNSHSNSGFYIEVLNKEPAPVILDSWKLYLIDRDGNHTIVSLYGQLAPGQRLMVGRHPDQLDVAHIPMSVGVSDVLRAVALIDPMDVVRETVGWGGATAEWQAPDGSWRKPYEGSAAFAGADFHDSEDRSISRIPDGQDTGSSSDDLRYGTATPGAPNSPYMF